MSDVSGSNSAEAGVSGIEGLATTARCWQNLLRIQNAVGIENIAQARHHIDVIFAEHDGHEFQLLHANAVLAGDRSANADAIFKDFFSGRKSAFGLVGITRIKKDQWMKIAV